LRWYQKFAGLIWVVFCLEIGAFLLVYPWMDGWTQNGLSDMVPVLQPWWDNTYFRGGVSGIGVLNIYIALSELFRLLRLWFFPQGDA